MNPKKSKEREGSEPSAPPPYNRSLDPDNATSPLDFEERQKEGEKHFYPEGGPEDPPVDERFAPNNRVKSS